MRAAYTIVGGDADTLIIRDARGRTTITNDAEAVVAHVHAHESLGSRKLLYFDSRGDLDELRHDGNGMFLGFAPGFGRK